MLKTVKRLLVSLLFVWVLLVVIMNIVVPKFQKSRPQGGNQAAMLPSEVQERILCIDDNQEALIRRLQIIRSAGHDLILSTYYLGDDDSGNDVMAAVYDAAERGVKVRILVDGFCELLQLRSSDSFQTLSAHENVEARVYNPVNPLLPLAINYRMHDKYLVADGKQYILGGRNNKNVSLGEYPGKHDIDRDILVLGTKDQGSSGEVCRYFEEIWSLPRVKPVKPHRNDLAHGVSFLTERFEALPDKYPEAFETVDFKTLTMPVESIHLLHNPVHPGNKSPELWHSLMQWIGRGKDVLVQTPYIICNKAMYRDLYQLTQEDRNIRILTNSPAKGANPCGCADYLNQRRNLRRTGAEIWEYAGGRSSHTKTLILDDRISIVGSFNFDMRSAYLDTEMMLVIDSPELNAHLRNMYDGYLRESRCMKPDGEMLLGEAYEKPRMHPIQVLIYSVLRLIILPVRHLL